MELLESLNTSQTTEEIVNAVVIPIPNPIVTVSEPKKTNKPIVKSRKRASLKEFATKTRMRREVLAGFRAWLRTDQFHFDDEWQELLTQYNNRKI